VKAGPDGIVLRSMTVDDVAAVAAIDRLSFPLPWSENSFRSDLTTNPAAHLLVAEQATGDVRRIAGYAGYWLVIDEAHLSTLAVDPGLRRRGVGERILREAMRHAARQGAELMTLEVRVSNDPARRLYAKLGFRVAGRRPHYYKDNLEDAILMTRDRLTEAVRVNGRGNAG
jgi:[ribosomal protein S18]-alanine N-acetyltransferase